LLLDLNIAQNAAHANQAELYRYYDTKANFKIKAIFLKRYLLGHLITRQAYFTVVS
jgi:hypothetical protein